MALALFIENFCSGMSTAAFMAFLMSLCNARYSATQFAFFSAIDSLVRLFAGPLAAMLVLQFGWVTFYGWSFILSLPALLLLLVLNKRARFDAPVVSYS
jgi:PAT family beta-lactamase induction signal transducer AmpG